MLSTNACPKSGRFFRLRSHLGGVQTGNGWVVIKRTRKKTIRLRQRQTHFFAHARSMNIDTDTHTSCFRSCLTIKTDDHHLFVGDWYRYRFSRLKHCYNRMYSMVQCIFGLFLKLWVETPINLYGRMMIRNCPNKNVC